MKERCCACPESYGLGKFEYKTVKSTQLSLVLVGLRDFQINPDRRRCVKRGSGNKETYVRSQSFSSESAVKTLIRLLRVVITFSVTSSLRGENDSKQSDEFQATKVVSSDLFCFAMVY